MTTMQVFALSLFTVVTIGAAMLFYRNIFGSED
jgi:hypothetical protein